MAYTVKDFPTKKALKTAVTEGKRVEVFSPGGMGTVPTNGRCSVEGPHYPKPHSWYAEVTLVDGLVTKVT